MGELKCRTSIPYHYPELKLDFLDEEGEPKKEPIDGTSEVPLPKLALCLIRFPPILILYQSLL